MVGCICSSPSELPNQHQTGCPECIVMKYVESDSDEYQDVDSEREKVSRIPAIFSHLLALNRTLDSKKPKETT